MEGNIDNDVATNSSII